MKKKKVLYFATENISSAKAFELSKKYGDKVQLAFRNSKSFSTQGPLEKCDAVAGDIPERYKQVLSVDKLLKKLEKPAEVEKPKVKEVPKTKTSS